MAQQTENPGTSSSSDAGGTKSEERRRKIGGKYDSVEDAVEELIKTRDSAFHETREELGAIKQLLERAMTPIGRNDYNGDQGYRRGSRDDDEDQVDAAEFLATPQKVLRRREEKLRQQLEQTNQRAMSTMIGNAAIVLRFQMKNPDLDEHEDLVQSFLGKTNPNDNLAKRLAAAGKATRTYLARIKGSSEDDNEEEDAGRNPDTEEFVEGTAKPGQGSKARSKSDEDEPTPDNELGDYISERKAFKSSRFQVSSK